MKQKFTTIIASMAILSLVALPTSASITEKGGNSGIYESEAGGSYTINVKAPGTFGNLLLTAAGDWVNVQHLTITGNINDTDMSYFNRMTNLKTLNLKDTDITHIGKCDQLSCLTSVELPTTVTTIEDYAFYKCESLATINIQNVTTIEDHAFYKCTSLATINIQNATIIEDNAFSECTSLATINIQNATTIENYAFYKCESLADVKLCDNLEEIPDYCFEYCSLLKNINLPSKLNRIGSYAFYGTKLKNTEIPEGVVYIGNSVFNYSSLESISLPSTITSIGSFTGYSSSGIINLKIYCNSVTPPTHDPYNYQNENITIYVPALSVNSYKLSDGWYHYNILPLDTQQTDITLSNDFTITNYNGLAKNANISITNNAEVTISAEDEFTFGKYTHEMQCYDYYYDNDYLYYYDYFSSLITYDNITAKDVCVKLHVERNQWTFISLPFDVNVSDIKYPDNTLWVIRKYSGADRAAMTGNTWQNMTDGMTLKAGEGYIIHCYNDDDNRLIEFTFPAIDNENKNKIFTNGDANVALKTHVSEHSHNRSWNLVGNPYPSLFRTRSIEHNGVITVWMGYNYRAYSLIDDNYILRPFEAFFVQCPLDTDKMTFKTEGRIHHSGITQAMQTRAKSEGETTTDRAIYNLILSNEEIVDRTRIVINEDAAMDYETSCDASKFVDTESSQIYVNDNGINYAIDERPLGDGEFELVTNIKETGIYTIKLDSRNSNGTEVFLTNTNTGEKVNITEEQEYSFIAKAKGIQKFSLTFTDGTTDIDINKADSDNAIESIYTIDGRKINNTDILPAGIYLIKHNGDVRKVFISK